MKSKHISKHWDLLLNKYMTELVPHTSSKEHWAGDECWCLPNRLMLKNSKQPPLLLRVWVHAGSRKEQSQDLLAAVDNVVDYWENLSKK
jgi:hypothetical protein